MVGLFVAFVIKVLFSFMRWLLFRFALAFAVKVCFGFCC